MHKFSGALVLILFGVVVLAASTWALDSPSSWVNNSDPVLQKVVDLPDNVFPSTDNLDCEKVTVRVLGTNTMTPDCVMPSVYGMYGQTGMIFNGSSVSVPIVPTVGFNTLRAVPNQGIFYSYRSAPFYGLFIYFYTSILDKMKPAPEKISGRWQYRLTKDPDFILRDAAGTAFRVNYATMAFSSNGSWMLVESPRQGFVRINMATFEITPFAPSLHNYYDIPGQSARVAISNDGRYAAISPTYYKEFKVYDINSCVDPVLPVDPKQPKCQSRDYWPYLEQQLPGLRWINQPRFMNNNQISFLPQYNFVSTASFKVGQFTLTAPGENVTGIEYLGMGDSFASGQGAYNYIDGTDTKINTCHLSSLSYPLLVSNSIFPSGRSVACSGAKVRDIIDSSNDYEGQVKDKIPSNKRNNKSYILGMYLPGYLVQNEFVQKYRPQTVTLSIGGNDVGFSDIVKTCVMPRLINTTCYPSYEDQQELVNRIKGIGEKLKTAYRTISSPGRTVYVVGYPQIVVEGGNCAANVHLDAKEIKMFVGLTATLNDVIKRAAESAGATYVDVSHALDGHRMCETKSSRVAVNGFTAGKDEGIGNFKFIGSESYHPNALGHELLKRSILRQTSNLRNIVGASVNTPLVTSDVVSALPAADAAITGRAVNVSLPDDKFIPDTVMIGTPTAVTISSAATLLKPSTQYVAKLNNESTALATISTDASGNLSGNVVLPPSTPCGSHTLHIYGTNMADQPVDITKVIYALAGNADCNGNGTADAAEPCGIMPKSGADADRDGIDDACDAVIDDPPTYTVTMTGSSIHAIRPE